MKSSTKETISMYIIGIGGVLLFVALLIFLAFGRSHSSEVDSSQFRGDAAFIKVYQVYDADTGVCYAVTDHGGICVMMTQDGSVKLINQGEPPTIHKNQE